MYVFVFVCLIIAMDRERSKFLLPSNISRAFAGLELLSLPIPRASLSECLSLTIFYFMIQANRVDRLISSCDEIDQLAVRFTFLSLEIKSPFKAPR
jgi:hypothetical protein